MSEVGPAGDIKWNMRECSDLLKFARQRKPESGTKWVLLISVASTIRYFVGDFDELPEFPTLKMPPDKYYALIMDSIIMLL